jgi:hypothetical protein
MGVREVLQSVVRWVHDDLLGGMPNTRYSATDKDGAMIYCDDLVTAFRFAGPQGTVYDMQTREYVQQ